MATQPADPRRRLGGFDVRVAGFGRAWLGLGYRRSQVDDFLRRVAAELDRYQDDLADTVDALRRQATQASRSDESEDPQVPAGLTVLEDAQSVAGEIVGDARERAALLLEAAEQSAVRLDIRARDTRSHLLAQAHRDARDLLDRAQADADALLAECAQRQADLDRAQSELELGVSYAQQRLDERARALESEARRLEELAGWLAEQDLVPETETSHQSATASRAASTTTSADRSPEPPRLRRVE